MDSAPSYPRSPTKTNNQWDGDFRRPTSPASRKDISRPTSPGAAATKVFRVLSNNVANAPQSKDGAGAQLEMTVTVDPLTQQIFNRTGETAPQATRQNSNDTTHSIPESERPRTSRSPGPPLRTDTGTTKSKGKEKGVSFLSRIIGGKKKEHQELARDDASIAEHRPEGNDAEIFSPISSNTEFNAARPQAPDYIRVRTRHTRKKHFDSLFLAQELMAGTQSNGPNTIRKKNSVSEAATVWAAEFSKDGRYLATAGHDKVVRIWAVLTSPEERQAELRRNSGSSHGSVPNPLSLTAQVFKSKPIKEYKGHTGTILDLSWSKNNFLLSSSMDKTVRLWHVTRDDCLCTFKHSDFVTGVAFHPKNDRFFLAGSLDCKIRLWSIPEKHVQHWHQTPEMITAVAFTPDGKTVVAGGADGLLTFYEADGLRYQTQIRAKSAHGKNSKGSKVTGIQAFQHPLNSTNGDTKLIVTTNDSRVRLYNFRDKSVEMKMKGCDNHSSQIRGSISDDQRYVCCGSEDNRAYIWPLDFEDHEDPTRRPLEHFQAHDTVVTCVRFAPTKSRSLLSQSADPIYDLCNPPPPTLRQERAPSQESSRPPTDTVDSPTPDPIRRQSTSLTTPSTSRSIHPSGNIIITCSLTGAIKVFRQDCATRHRARTTKAASSLTTSRPSSLKTKSSNRSLRSGRDSTSTQPPSERIMSWRQNVTTAPSIRTGSISSKHSTRSLSPRKSGQYPRSVSGPQPARPTGATNGTKTPTDSFVSSVASTPATQSPALFSSNSLKMTKIDPDAAPSRKGMHRVGSGPAVMHGPGSHSAPPKEAETDRRPATGPSSSSATKDNVAPRTERQLRSGAEAEPLVPSTEANPLVLMGEQSNLFWNVNLAKEMAERARQGFEAGERERWHDAREEGSEDEGPMQKKKGGGRGLGAGVGLGLGRQESFVSWLSIEVSVSPGTSRGGSREGSRERG